MLCEIYGGADQSLDAPYHDLLLNAFNGSKANLLDVIDSQQKIVSYFFEGIGNPKIEAGVINQADMDSSVDYLHNIGRQRFAEPETQLEIKPAKAEPPVKNPGFLQKLKAFILGEHSSSLTFTLQNSRLEHILKNQLIQELTEEQIQKVNELDIASLKHYDFVTNLHAIINDKKIIIKSADFQRIKAAAFLLNIKQEMDENGLNIQEKANALTEMKALFDSLATDFRLQTKTFQSSG